jgi:hypothetical protein
MSFLKGKAAEAASEPSEKDVGLGAAADRQSFSTGEHCTPHFITRQKFTSDIQIVSNKPAKISVRSASLPRPFSS